MSESDKDIFADLDKSLQSHGKTASKAIEQQKAYFAEHMPELEQMVRWWNIKMDEFNYGRNKFRIKEDYNKDRNGWVVYLFKPPTLGKGIVIQLAFDYVSAHGVPHWCLVIKVFSDNKLINKDVTQLSLGAGLIPLRILMTKTIAETSNYQDAIPDK